MTYETNRKPPKYVAIKILRGKPTYADVVRNLEVETLEEH